MMPESVLNKAGSEISDYMGSGMSVMEMSHRSSPVRRNFAETKRKLKETLNVPDSHEILFLQGGATLQFAAIPLNLMGSGKCADYAVTGNFSGLAAKEAEKYGSVHIACDSSDRGHSYIPSELSLSADSSLFLLLREQHHIRNRVAVHARYQGQTIVCDMSSDILSKPVDVSKFGLIYAGAQKNMAPAGLTVVIVDKALPAGRWISAPRS